MISLDERLIDIAVLLLLQVDDKRYALMGHGRLMMWHRYITLTLVLLLTVATQIEAGMRNFFRVENCSWKATHIVVIDEEGVVLDSLKGDLLPGFRMPLEQLKLPSQHEIDQAMENHFNRGKIKLSNKRRILFLIKNDQNWKPANDAMNISMAWHEGEMMYGFQQLFNPGPLLLSRLEENDKRFYQIIKENSVLQTRLHETQKIPDLAKRAQALTEFIVYPRNLYCQREALIELSRCGEAAEKVILQLLDDETKAQNTFQTELIRMYGGMFPDRARPWLMREVVNGLAYWKKLAPELKPDWWTRGSARQHTAYTRLYYSLSVLADIGITEADREPIESLINFWKSQPELNAIGRGYDNLGLVSNSQIVEAAQRCLKKK